MILSFSWTTPALLAGAKTITRRRWKPEHAARFTVGRMIDAWDHSPRTGRGQKVALIRIVREVRRESSASVGPEDFRREGFAWLEQHGDLEAQRFVRTIWQHWLREPEILYVVEFELVDVWPFVMHGDHPHDARGGCILIPLGVLR